MENDKKTDKPETGSNEVGNGKYPVNELLKKDDAHLYEMAQFKLGIISPAVYETHDERSNKAYLKKAAGKTYTMPDHSTARFGLSTLERWVSQYKAKGIQALFPKERSDKGIFRRLPMRAQVEIAQMVKKYPEIKYTKIRKRLIKENLIQSEDVSVDTISRFVKAHNLRYLSASENEEEVQRIRNYFLESESGYLWEADTMYLTKIQYNGQEKWVYLQGIIDNHSRLIVSAQCFMADNAINFQDVLYRGVRDYHIPVKLLVDNGSPYINADLKRICSILGIVLIHTRTNDGATKGAIERFWLSTDVDIGADIILDNLDTLEKIQKRVDEWVYEYNHRKNRGVDGIPRERYEASELRHNSRHPASEEELDRAFLHTKICTVRCGAIQHNRVMYEIPDEVRKLEDSKKVQIFYNPRKVEETIFVQGKDEKEYRLHKLDKEKNAGKKKTGGRTAELKEKAAGKAADKMTKSEAHAERRYQRRQKAKQQANADTSAAEVPSSFSQADSEPVSLTLDYTTV